MSQVGAQIHSTVNACVNHSKRSSSLCRFNPTLAVSCSLTKIDTPHLKRDPCDPTSYDQDMLLQTLKPVTRRLLPQMVALLTGLEKTGSPVRTAQA